METTPLQAPKAETPLQALKNILAHFDQHGYMPTGVSPIDFARHVVAQAEHQEIERAILQKRLDAVYDQRNTLAIAFARMAILLGWKAGYGIDTRPAGWDDDWRTVVYVDLPAGTQVSWHMNPSTSEDARATLPKYDGKWNGTFHARNATWHHLLPKTSRVLTALSNIDISQSEPYGLLAKDYEGVEFKSAKIIAPLQKELEGVEFVSTRAYFVKGYDPVTHVYHVGGHKFSVEDLEGVADGLDCYEKSVNVGNVTGEGEEHLESTTAFAARFIRLHLAPAAASQIDKHAFYNVRLGQQYGAFQFRPDELVYITHSPQCIRELMTYNMIRAQSGDLHGRLDCARFDELKAHIGTLDKGRDTGDNQMRAANIAMQSEKE